MRRQLPTCFGWTRYIRPTFANHFPRTRYIRPTFANHFPRTRYIRSHSPKAIFEKNVTCLDTFARVICHFGEFGASGHCLIVFLSLLHSHYFFLRLLMLLVFATFSFVFNVETKIPDCQERNNSPRLDLGRDSISILIVINCQNPPA